jgi:Trypsin-like peptidase domain/Carboxypeptidase regulatory-like domain
MLVMQAAPPALAAPLRQEVFDPTKAQRATVYVMQVYTNPLGQAIISCVGSGTLVSADGLILTNAHVVLPGANCRSDQLVIAMTVRVGEAPVARYYARLVEKNVGWDLAVLQITTDLDGRPAERGTLTLPFVELDVSESAKLDDTINVVGYVTPDEKSSGAAQVVRGTISGFTAEARVGDRAWIKTNAVVPGGMSGGGAYNAAGQLIGVPTIEPAQSSGAALDCRRIQDSNGDRRIDDQDACIPVSGFVNALRPARLARGLVLAAQLGITPELQPPAEAQPKPGDLPTFSRLFFTPGVNQAGMPTTVVTGMPAGTTRLYLFFDFDNMVDGMVYELRTALDGVPNPTFSLAPATWSGGRQGLWYIGSTAQAWPNGTYDFALFIEGTRIASKQITIGGPARQDPTFSDIAFGVLDPDRRELVSAGNVLPVGNTINAQFVFNNIPPNAPFRQRWFYEGIQVTQSAETWTQGENGSRAVSASGSANQPLQPGRYRLELYIGEQLAATSDFLMAGALTALRTEIFNALSFATDLKDNQPAGSVGTAFPNTIQRLYATFNWRELGAGTPWTWRWTVDNNPLFEVTQPWENAPGGTAAWVRLDAQGHLPDGSYKLELLVAGVVMVSATAKVGLGQLPVTTFGIAEGVQLQGRVTDAETGQGIPGVAFIVLKTDFATRDFTWDMSQVYEMSLTDADGRFSLSKLLVRSETDEYSIVVVARGYLPVMTDGMAINAKTKNPLILNVELNRD